MLSRHLTQGHYLWPKPEGTWPSKDKHIVHAERMHKGFRQFDVRPTDKTDSAAILGQPAHWLSFSQVRTNFKFSPPPST